MQAGEPSWSHTPADNVATQLLAEARKRVAGLAALERELEDRIRGRWEAAEEAVRRRSVSFEEELEDTRRRTDLEQKDLRQRTEKEGRAAGFREGFARGREDGYRLGVEEGRREGLAAGKREAFEEVSAKLHGELAGGAAALTRAAVELEERRDHLLAECRREVIHLAFEIASKLVKREVREVGDVTLRNVEHAVELIFRRGVLVIQVHPDDRAALEKTLKDDPRWVEGFDSVEVRGAPDVGRGGCRLVSGAGTVDAALETQLELIAEALGAPGAESRERAAAPREAPKRSRAARGREA
jgi:flagellar assembly protein FliH